MLAHAEIEGQRLTDEEIVHFAMLMVFAGGETVEKTLATFIRNLVAHPEQLAALAGRPDTVGSSLGGILALHRADPHDPPQDSQRSHSERRNDPGRGRSDLLSGSANRDERRFVDSETIRHVSR